MTLWEALLASTGTDEAAELRRRGPRFGIVFFMVPGAPETEHDRLQERFSQLLECAETTLRKRLKTGELVATGHDPRDPFSPRLQIPADRWAHVKIDYEASTVEVGQVRIIEVEISAQGGLRLNKTFKRARLGVVDFPLSDRSFDLLLTLAEGATNKSPFVTLEKLAKKHFENATNDKALGQGIEDLRNQLGSKIGRQAADDLIVNIRRKGYRLSMPAAEIVIED
jgi:DNA-binding winged helix-turn-helix (wHTH) protein